jgi:hypothetical protein
MLPEAIKHPARLFPEEGHPVIVPPTAVGTPLKAIPTGKVSAIVIAAVVGPFKTAIVMV